MAEKEAFWAKHDPHGDCFGTPIPIWGCIAFLAVVAAAAYALFG
ncbi:MAG TPA: hypothetical protein VFZ91_00145 [Allosphingosinicella sp.]